MSHDPYPFAETGRRSDKPAFIEPRASNVWKSRIVGYGLVGGAVLAVTGLTAAMLGMEPAGSQDVPVEHEVEAPIPHGYQIIEMPNRFENVLTFCHQGNRIYRSTYASGDEAIAVVPNDPTCKE